MAHIAGHQGNTPQRHYHTDGRHAPVERGFHRRQVVHDAVGIVNDGGEQLEAHSEPQPAAQYRRAQRVDKIFLLDLPVGIAQRFQRADLSALLLHHTGHCGQAHQCRHRQEEYWENGRNVIDSCGVIAKFAHTQCQLLAGIQVPLRRRELFQHFFGIGQLQLAPVQLGLAVRYLLAGIGAFLLEFLFPVRQLDAGLGQLPLAAVQPLFGLFQLGFIGIQLFAAVLQLFFAAFVLAGRAGYLFFHGGKIIVHCGLGRLYCCRGHIAVGIVQLIA